ncbi:MAG: hypothetical protein JWP00_547 [Chloroflexi bacterium]|nr:hypothetical protein [Chloroflexota bacterium]
MNLAEFRNRVRDYRRQSGRSQLALAYQLGLHPTLLSNKLNGVNSTNFTSLEIRGILKILAEWEALRTRAEAFELLALAGLTPDSFTEEEWQEEPLARLEPDRTAGPLPLKPGPVVAARPQSDQAKKPRHNLPTPLTPLIGREREIEQVANLLDQPQIRLLTLTGPGGIGKTRLGLQVARQVTDKFPDGVFFVSLAPISNPELVVSIIAHQLGLIESGNLSLLEKLKTYLQDKQLLLVLDNYEQVLPAATLVSDLLQAAPGLKILVTSRAVLHLYEENELVVPPLDLPDPSAGLPGPGIVLSSAVQLYLQRARALQHNFELTTESSLAVAEICRRLDGLPLAIELAAVRSKLYTPQAMLARLTGPGETPRLNMLTRGAQNMPERQQALRNTINWSYELLTPKQARLFIRLAVFAGGSTLEAVEIICREPDTEDQTSTNFEILEGIQALLDNSMLQQAEGAEGEPRLVMLETIREFALEKLVESKEIDQLRERHLAYFLDLAEQAGTELRGPQTKRWLDRLQDEYNNLRAAFNWALSMDRPDGDKQAALKLAGSLSLFWELRGYFLEGRDWLYRALAQCSEEPLAPRARALDGQGRLAYLQGDYKEAQPLLEKSLQLWEDLQDKTQSAQTLLFLGNIANRIGKYTEARALLEKSLEITRQTGNKFWIADALNTLGLANWFQGNYPRAREIYQESLAIWQEKEDIAGIAMTMSNLGAVDYQQGDYEQARRWQEESLALWQGLGNKLGATHGLQHLGLIAYAEGDFKQARLLLTDSLEMRREIGDRWGIGRCLAALGCLASLENNHVDARSLLLESVNLRREVGDRWGTAESLVELGRVARRTRDKTTALVHFKEAWALGFELGLKKIMIACLEGLAFTITLDRADPATLKLAGRWLKTAANLRVEVWAALPLSERAEFNREANRLKMSLGEEAFAALEPFPLDTALRESIAGIE